MLCSTPTADLNLIFVGKKLFSHIFFMLLHQLALTKSIPVKRSKWIRFKISEFPGYGPFFFFIQQFILPIQYLLFYYASLHYDLIYIVCLWDRFFSATGNPCHRYASDCCKLNAINLNSFPVSEHTIEPLRRLPVRLHDEMLAGYISRC